MKKWLIKLIVNKIIKLAREKVSVVEYAEIAADTVDEYLDKNVGVGISEKIQEEITYWLSSAVDTFTKKLKSN